MIHQKIMEILLSLHEKASGPLQRVYEICLSSMEHVEGDIKSVADSQVFLISKRMEGIS